MRYIILQHPMLNFYTPWKRQKTFWKNGCGRILESIKIDENMTQNYLTIRR